MNFGLDWNKENIMYTSFIFTVHLFISEFLIWSFFQAEEAERSRKKQNGEDQGKRASREDDSGKTE